MNRYLLVYHHYFLIVLSCFLINDLTAQTQQPNILLFIADDMNWRDCTPYGNTEVITPNIARLAREGMRFDNMYTATAMCSPTRQQLFTGLYPVRNGAFPNHSQVYPGVKSLGHHFLDLGYRVGLIGKQHYGPVESFPFQYFKGRQHDDGKGRDIDLRKIRTFMEPESQPYFLIVAENQPHTPWNKGNPAAYDPASLTIPPDMIDTPFTREQLTRYYAEITYADSLLGVCLKYLEETGQADNTIVIFTSEQGAQFPFGKWTCYDLGLKTAFIARWLGKIQPGSHNAALTQYVDVVPTLLEAVGANPDTVQVGITNTQGDDGFDGKSFLSILQSNNQQHRDYVYGVQTTRGIHQGSACYPIRSVRSNRFKYIWNLNSDSPFYNVVTTRKNDIFENWQQATRQNPERHAWVMKYQQRPTEELYDLENDPYELNNLAEHPNFQEEKETLRQELIDWMEIQGDQGTATEMKALERQHRANEWQPCGGTTCND
ncbi:MAG: sulfatase [Bacteroidota bacterium]